MTRLRVDLSYDGGAFHGWASQPGLQTAQGVLEDFLDRMLRLDPVLTLTVTGRTDAGVRACGQVCHVDIENPALPPTDLLRRLRRIYPGNTAIRGVTETPNGFDARFSAVWRRHCYRLIDSAQVPNPLLRNHVVQLRHPLHLGTVQETTRPLTGLRDFAPFYEVHESATAIRSLWEFTVARRDDGVVEVHLLADAFCHSVVRALVGALTMVGTGRRSLAWLEKVANSDHCCGEVPLVPTHDLVLGEVGYPADEQLASRAHEARARRNLKKTQATTSPTAPPP